jgi:hypothetical protein
MATVTYPSNFKSVVQDFTSDLSITFPEFSYLWKKWSAPDLSEVELQYLFEYCLTVYPERFFDILNQNAEIFDTTNDTNTVFLPNVDFKLLFNCKDITENTLKAMWKYLQLMLFTIVSGVKDKADFGDAMNMFDGIDEEELQTKLNDTISGMSEFFKTLDSEGPELGQGQGQDQDQGEAKENPFENFKNMFENMPSANNIQEHLKGIFDGKIGKLAKEMAEEITDEFKDIFDGENPNINSTQDVLKELMKNPKKIMDLMKKVGGKLDTKMKNGDVSKEELMKEASEMMGKMKDMGGADQFADMFKAMAKGMGGLGKNMRMDTSAMDRMTKMNAKKEQMRKNIELKQQQKAQELLRQQEQMKKQAELQNTLRASYTLEQNTNNNLVFRLDGAEAQEKSFIHPDLLAEMEAEDKQKKGGQKDGQKDGQTKKKKSKKGK